MCRRAFLLNGISPIALAMPSGRYDVDLDLNTIEQDGAVFPFVLYGSAPTESKTFQYPADDDPDPDDERCY